MLEPFLENVNLNKQSVSVAGVDLASVDGENMGGQWECLKHLGDFGTQQIWEAK